jgi:hypothetical protein
MTAIDRLRFARSNGELGALAKWVIWRKWRMNFRRWIAQRACARDGHFDPMSVRVGRLSDVQAGRGELVTVCSRCFAHLRNYGVVA